jgi:bacterioferritin (cytochrome b1)
VERFKKLGKGLQRVLTHDRRQEILALLGREYVDKMKDSRQYRLHSEQMRYEQFRDQLLRIADEEEKHSQWLKDRIIALGGEIPQISPTPEDGWNSWEDLRLDLTEEKRHEWDLRDQLPMVERVDFDTADTLRRILAEESNHRALLTKMLMRSDPLGERPPYCFWLLALMAGLDDFLTSSGPNFDTVSLRRCAKLRYFPRRRGRRSSDFQDPTVG